MHFLSSRFWAVSNRSPYVSVSTDLRVRIWWQCKSKKISLDRRDGRKRRTLQLATICAQDWVSYQYFDQVMTISVLAVWHDWRQSAYKSYGSPAWRHPSLGCRIGNFHNLVKYLVLHAILSGWPGRDIFSSHYSYTNFTVNRFLPLLKNTELARPDTFWLLCFSVFIGSMISFQIRDDDTILLHHL